MMRRAIGIDNRGAPVAVAAVRGIGGRVRVSSVDPVRVQEGRLSAGTAVSVGMPARTAVTTWIQAPFPSRRKARRVAPALLDMELPFPLENCIWSVVAEQSDATGCAMLAVAARREDVQKRLDELAAAGLDPHVLDHEGLALWSRSLDEFPPPPQERFRVVVYRHPEGVVMAIGSPGKLRGVYTVAGVSRAQMERLLVAHLGSEWRTALTTPGELLFFCCGPSGAGADACLREALGVTAAITVHTADAPDHFLARALAVRALLPGPWHCNLRRGELAHPDWVARDRRGFRLSLAVLVVSGLLLGGLGLSVGREAQRRLDNQNRAFRAEASRIAGYPVLARGRDAINEVSLAVDTRLAELRVFEQQLQPSLLHLLPRVMEAVLHGEGAIERLDLAPGRAQLTVRAPDREALEQIGTGLEAAGLRPVQAPDVRPASGGGVIADLSLMGVSP